MKPRQKQLWIIDSLPIPVIQFHLVPSSTNNWSCYEADYGRVESKKQIIFGYKLHLLVTASGVIVDFELAPASETDLAVGYPLLSNHQNKQVIGDKAYIIPFLKNHIALAAFRKYGNEVSLAIVDLVKLPRIWLNCCCICSNV